jgi:hypothetical protein
MGYETSSHSDSACDLQSVRAQVDPPQAVHPPVLALPIDQVERAEERKGRVMIVLLHTAEFLILWMAASVTFALIWAATIYLCHAIERMYRRRRVRHELSQLDRISLDAMVQWRRKP